MNSAGLTVQNRFLRKLHKILTLPVKDLHNEAEKRILLEKDKNLKFLFTQPKKQSKITKVINWGVDEAIT